MANPIQEAEALRAELAQRFAIRDQVLQNLQTQPPALNPLQSGFNEAINALTFDITDLPTNGTVPPLVGRFGGSTGGVGLGMLGGGLIGGPLGALAGGALMGFGQGFGRGVDEQTDRGIPLDQVNYLGPTVQGAAEGVLNALPPLKGASLLTQALKTAGRDAAIGLPVSISTQLLNNGTVDPMRTALDTAGFAAGGAASGALTPIKPDIPSPAWRGPFDAVAGQADSGLMAEARARLKNNLGWVSQPENITIDPLLYARKELTAVDEQLQNLLNPKSVETLPGFRDVGDALKAVDPEPPAPPAGPQPGPNGYIARETINAPIDQTFLNRSSAMRGARNLGLERTEVQPVQVGPGEWMIHKVEPTVPKADVPSVAPKAGELPPETVLVNPAEPARLPDNNAAGIPGAVSPPAANPEAPKPTPRSVLPGQAAKPATVVKALEGLNPQEQVTVHDFDLSTVEPGTKIDGLKGTFQGVDEDGLPILSRKAGLKRPGESGFAHDEESLASLLKQAGDTLQPGDDAMLRDILQDVQAGQATQFVGRAKQGRSTNMEASADTPGTMAAFGTKTNDRVLGLYYKPASAKTPSQIVARVVNDLGEQATRIIREAGNPDVGYMRTGSGPRTEMHTPSTIATQKRALVSDADIQKAGIVRKTAMGTKLEAHPIVRRIDEAIQANNSEKLHQALRDFDRLPPELQKQLGVQSGCVK